MTVRYQMNVVAFGEPDEKWERFPQAELQVNDLLQQPGVKILGTCPVVMMKRSPLEPKLVRQSQCMAILTEHPD